MPKPIERNAQLRRLLNLIRDLSRLDGVDIYELSDRYGTSTRTIRRDLEALQEAGLPVSESPSPDGNRKIWRLDVKDKLAKFANLIDVSHYRSLIVAMKAGARLSTKSALFANLEHLCETIEAALGPRQKEQLRAIDRAFVTHEKFAYKRTPLEVFIPLIDAISQHRLCVVEYTSPQSASNHKVKKFHILPLCIFAHDGSSYLHAFVPRFKKVILLNLHRLHGLVVTSEKGTPPADFHPERWAGNIFGIFAAGNETNYKLRFTANVAPFIRERDWHPTQQTKDLKDGGLELTFRCAESYEVTKWVTSWRRDVDVVAPASLRKELASIGAQWVERYGGDA